MGTVRRWSVIAVAVITTAVVIGIVLPGITLWAPLWLKEFGVGPDSVMLATTLNQVGSAAVAPFVGYAVSRVAIRTLMLLGVTLTGLALIGVAYATAMWQVTLLHALILSAGVVLAGPVVGQVLAVRLFQENRGLAIGIVTAGASISTFTMPPLINVLLSNGMNWRSAELVMAGIVFALLPLIYFIVRETPAALVDDDAPEVLPQPTMTIREIVTSRPFIAILMTLIPLWIVFNAIYYPIGMFLGELGASTAEVGTMVSLMGFISLFAVVTFGGLADRISPWTLMALSTLVLTVCFLLVSVIKTYTLLLLVLPVIGFTFGGIMSLGPAMFAKHFGSANFALAGGLSQPFFVVAAFSPFIVGLMRPGFNDYSAVFMVIMLVLPISYLGLALMRLPGNVQPGNKAVAPA